MKRQRTLFELKVVEKRREAESESETESEGEKDTSAAREGSSGDREIRDCGNGEAMRGIAPPLVRLHCLQKLILK